MVAVAMVAKALAVVAVALAAVGVALGAAATARVANGMGGELQVASSNGRFALASKHGVDRFRANNVLPTLLGP